MRHLIADFDAGQKSASGKSAADNRRDSSRATRNTEVGCVFGIRTDKRPCTNHSLWPSYSPSTTTKLQPRVVHRAGWAFGACQPAHSVLTRSHHFLRIRVLNWAPLACVTVPS